MLLSIIEIFIIFIKGDLCKSYHNFFGHWFRFFFTAVAASNDLSENCYLFSNLFKDPV